MRIAQHILVPTDFSDAAEHALDAAIILARQNDARITVAHVLAVDPIHVETDELDQREARVRELEQNAHRELDARRARLLEAQVADVKTALARGRSAALSLCELAQAQDIDLIVMATHGRTGLPRLLVGSVAENVVRHAPCPVFVVRAPSAKRPGSTVRPPPPDPPVEGEPGT